MARMVRTQVTLDEAEYRFLKTEAAMREVNLSSLVRALFREDMLRATEEVPHVWDVTGLVETSDVSGKDHDEVIYNTWAEESGEVGERDQTRVRRS